MWNKIGTGLITLGTVCLLSALSLWAYDVWDAWRAGQSVTDIQIELEDAEDEIQQTYPHEDDPFAMIDGYAYIGTLSVPRFGLELPVISTWSYPALRKAPCCYAGSAGTNDLVICGHNYERHFGHIHNLRPGDSVTFTNVLGHVFFYEVEEVVILQPTEVESMISGDWDLTLFTCTIGGRTRVTVRCRQTDDEEA